MRAIHIAVCGVVPRIGTTTAALQILSYLKLKNQSVAYLDMTSGEYLKNILQVYSEVEEKENHIIYEDIDMYASALDIKEEYQYIVKDYGCLQDEDFQKISYLEQDLKVVVMGVKPNEMEASTEILKHTEYSVGNFLFNFVPYDQREDILLQMDGWADRSFFLSYTPDPFSYDGSNNKSIRALLQEVLHEKYGSVEKVSKFSTYIKRYKSKWRSYRSYIYTIICTFLLSSLLWFVLL